MQIFSYCCCKIYLLFWRALILALSLEDQVFKSTGRLTKQKYIFVSARIDMSAVAIRPCFKSIWKLTKQRTCCLTRISQKKMNALIGAKVVQYDFLTHTVMQVSVFQGIDVIDVCDSHKKVYSPKTIVSLPHSMLE